MSIKSKMDIVCEMLERSASTSASNFISTNSSSSLRSAHQKQFLAWSI
ncbi:9262_t:CDS:2 [Entrophospora sp. SA101]|nr:9262_t:CDS:2 [Entrophospora sp. SA101]